MNVDQIYQDLKHLEYTQGVDKVHIVTTKEGEEVEILVDTFEAHKRMIEYVNQWPEVAQKVVVNFKS